MSTAMKRGFAIGFALVAILGGLWAWREGLLRPSGERRVEVPAELVERPKPPAAPQKPPAAPQKPPAASEKPPAAPNGAAPQAAPGAAPTPPPPAAQARPEAAPSDSRSAAVEPKAEATPAPGGGAAGAGQGGPKPQEKGAFDVVRVEPSGDSVVAGRCAAGCTAELTSNGRVIDKATADASGSFAMTPPTLPPGDHQLGLTVTTPEGRKETSEQTVTVSVPKAPSKDVVVVLNEPDAPSKILQKPGQEPAASKADGGDRAAALGAGPKAPPAAEAVALSLGAIDAENGRFFVQGAAPAGSKLRIYLNNAPIAEATAGADGRWSLRVERGLAPGRYTARVDHLGPDGKVVKRAEAGFDYEPDIAAATPAKPEAPAARPEPSSPAPAEETPAPQGRTDAAASPAAAPDRRPAGPAEASEPPAPPAAPSNAAGSTTTGVAGAEPSAVSPAPSSGASAASSAPDLRSGAQGRPSAEQSQAAAPPPPPSPAGGDGDPANPVVASIDTATVKRGDSLWRISRTTYGHGRRYTVIFSANDDQIRNPNLIYPGQVLVLPTEGSDAAESTPR